MLFQKLHELIFRLQYWAISQPVRNVPGTILTWHQRILAYYPACLWPFLAQQWEYGIHILKLKVITQRSIGAASFRSVK
jgi:hypothetical protein